MHVKFIIAVRRHGSIVRLRQSRNLHPLSDTTDPDDIRFREVNGALFQIALKLPLAMSITLLHIVGFGLLAAWGLRLIPTGRSVVLAYTTPLWVIPGARLFLGERLTLRRLGGGPSASLASPSCSIPSRST